MNACCPSFRETDGESSTPNGNGITASFAYNSRLQLQELAYRNGATDLFKLTYNYGTGNNGQIQSITDNVDASRSMAYTFHAENRIKQVDAGSTATYSYDGHNRRVKTVAGATTTVFIFSDQLGSKPLVEYTNGTLSREYVYFGDRLIATALPGGVAQYHHSDHLSIRLTTDATGTVLGTQAHYPFGEAWYQTGTTTAFLFTSYYRDSSAGLDYAVNRFHSYRLGRFQAADLQDVLTTCTKPGMTHRFINPRQYTPQDANLYAYAANDAANRTDPLGLFYTFDFPMIDPLFGPDDLFHDFGWFGGNFGGVDPWSPREICKKNCLIAHTEELIGCTIIAFADPPVGVLCVLIAEGFYQTCLFICEFLPAHR